MVIIATILVGLVALEHMYILVLEMFLWTTPRAMKSFGMTKENAQITKSLAANQGLYNGFLAAGLVWGLFHPDASIGRSIEIFSSCACLWQPYSEAPPPKNQFCLCRDCLLL